jgi:diguanylate cyclase (GGDEF)-like protein
MYSVFLGGIGVDMPRIFAIAFSAACALSFFIGIYTLYLNPRSKVNILFFAMNAAIGIWAFGLGMAVAADDLAAALFWRRFSALGWGAFFSVLLHFFHVFTGRDKTDFKRWFYALLYLPAIAVYLGFTYFPALNPGQYNLVMTPLGWVNVAVNNAWDWFYVAYYVLYSLAGYYLMWRWGCRSGNPRKKKQACMIVLSFACTLLLGTLTDTLGNTVFSLGIPQLAPILMLFPAFVIYYSIKKYGLLNPGQVDEDAILMSDQIRTKITNYLSNAFLFAAILNIIATYLMNDNADLTEVLIVSGAFILIGVLFQAIQRSVRRKSVKDVLNAIAFSLIVPALTLRYIGSAGVTVWAFPMILLIISLVYGRSFILIMLSVSILVTQSIVWLLKPEVTMTIGGADHVVRLGMFMIAIWFAYFVRKVFQAKLHENAEQIRSQQIVMDITTDFVSVSGRNLDEKIDAALSGTGAYLKQDRAYIYLFDEKRENLTCRSVWFDRDKMSEPGILTDIGADGFPCLTARIRDGQTFIVSDAAVTYNDTGGELLRLLGSFDKALAAMPIVIKNKVYGFFGVDGERKSKKWPETQLAYMKIITNILAETFEKILQENEITQMAFYDYLTKLPNRVMFKDRVIGAISAAKRTGKTVAVVFLDLDAFKAVNDSVGHDGGDALIVMVAEKLSMRLRNTGIVSRFTGDKFLILLSGLNTEAETHLAVQEILDIFDKPFITGGQEFFVTASAGVALYPQDGEDTETLIKNSDIAMYKAKEQGKNSYLFCTAEMKKEILNRLTLSSSLFRALERHELQLYYQPQVDVFSKKIVGAEALLRWIHPEKGLIPPGLFIPLAEQNGLIGPIGDWVLMTACLQCRTWQMGGLPDIRVAVNVSALQLRNPAFVYRVQQILEETQLLPQYLELEVTESAAASEAGHCIEVLSRLKQLGVSISIDDFGTEYSSLSRLTAMPIDRVKLDMQFVRGIGRGEKENAIIRGIIGLAHSLGHKILAEGVETEHQLGFLTERHCDEIQGYFFSRPVPPEDFEAMLKGSQKDNGVVK